MIPKEAIEKAIEGGWQVEDVLQTGNLIVDTKFMHQQATLDPSFWKCLGKAQGWQGKHEPLTDMLVLQAHVHKFIDLILTGGDTEKFWRELLDK